VLPDISYFAENKSDRFLVDFDDIIAGHPYLGARSPAPHEAAHVNFSHSDPRWLNASKPSDYPPIYAVADGVVERVETYSILDLTRDNPPWWHVAYQIDMKIATDGDTNVSLALSIEPRANLTNKPRSYFDDFVLVSQGDKVRKGDILGYMYVPPFTERVGQRASSHIHFTLYNFGRSVDGDSATYPPAIFTEEIVEQFGEIYRNPREGWASTSFEHDWMRGRGVPSGMGWMIDAQENPFGDNPLDVLMYDGIRDMELDGNAHLDPVSLGFREEDLLFALNGRGDFVTDPVHPDTEWRAIVASVGGPSEFVMFFEDGNRESSIYQSGPDRQGPSLSAAPPMYPEKVVFRVSDPDNWGWAIAVAPADAPYTLPGDNVPEVSCPPGCPPLP